MSDDNNQILYPGSPFVAQITRNNIRTVRKDIIMKIYPSSVTIAYQILSLGIELNHFHEIDFNWISNTFGVTLKDIDMFLFGYTIPPSLIVGSYKADEKNFREAFQEICPPTEDELLIRINRYKSSILLNCYNIYSSMPQNRRGGGQDIYELCAKYPFSINSFYKLGIESSKNIFLDFFSRLEKFH